MSDLEQQIAVALDQPCSCETNQPGHVLYIGPQRSLSECTCCTTLVNRIVAARDAALEPMIQRLIHRYTEAEIALVVDECHAAFLAGLRKGKEKS